MNETFRVNSIVVGLLFMITMLLGMIDSYFIMPKLSLSLPELQLIPSTLLVGVFSVFFMAIGVVGIATTIFPIVKKQSQAIAITYVSFRVVECLLLIFGAILYLFLISIPTTNHGLTEALTELPFLVSTMKLYAFQLSMVTLGIGSTLLCLSFYKSKAIPRWLSVWGILGYVCLFVSAVLDMLGIISTTSGFGALLYIPGGLWELLVFPIYLFVRGFSKY